MKYIADKPTFLSERTETVIARTILAGTGVFLIWMVAMILIDFGHAARHPLVALDHLTTAVQTAYQNDPIPFWMVFGGLGIFALLLGLIGLLILIARMATNDTVRAIVKFLVWTFLCGAAVLVGTAILIWAWRVVFGS